ncbi:MAG: DNA polymerase beta superfamily protein [Candidatus Acidiferrales bacterium]
MENFAQYGFPYPSDLLMTFVGGSQLHGAKLQARDDTDWYGVFIEPPNLALGLDGYPHFVFTTGGQRGGNRPHDVDVCLYSLRKWAALAAKGNPSVLHFLFARPEFQTAIWEAFSRDPVPFLARTHVKSFLGFANDQLRRLLNQRSKDVNRPELVEAHGYDTKYAMHLIRLYGEARELMEYGRISLPRPDASHLIAIRNGKYTLGQIREMAEQMERDALAASEHSALPNRVDRSEISSRITRAYLSHWEQNDSQN